MKEWSMLRKLMFLSSMKSRKRLTENNPQEDDACKNREIVYSGVDRSGKQTTEATD